RHAAGHGAASRPEGGRRPLSDDDPGAGGQGERAAGRHGQPRRGAGVMADDDIVEIDVCGLQPPEPLERVLEALSRLRPGQRLRMLIDREPRPLYGILERNGYAYEATLRDDYIYDILIRTRE